MDYVSSAYERWTIIPQPRKLKLLGGITFIFYAVFLMLLVSYAFGGTRKKKKAAANVVVFMEAMPGPLMALRYLSKRADVRIAMIVLTVSGWNVNVNAAYENTVSFLEMLRAEGYSSDIPVYYGNSAALVNEKTVSELSYNPYKDDSTLTTCTYRRAIPPATDRSSDNLFDADDILDTWTVPASRQKRLTFFADALNTYLAGSTATFLTLGAATDAAWFLENYPDRRPRVESVYLAGGTFVASGGNTKLFYTPNSNAEMNFFLDPLAANFIAHGTHGRPVTIFSLEAAPLCTQELNEKLFSNRVTGNKTENVVARAISGMKLNLGISVLKPPVELAAAAYFADVYVRNGATVATATVGVVNGNTMATDGTSRATSDTPTGTKANVVMSVDSTVFWNHYTNVDSLPFPSY